MRPIIQSDWSISRELRRSGISIFADAVTGMQDGPEEKPGALYSCKVWGPYLVRLK